MFEDVIVMLVGKFQESCLNIHTDKKGFVDLINEACLLKGVGRWRAISLR
jgi:hypothetical protein